MKIKEAVAVTFIIRNLSDRSLVAWREDERFRALRELVTDGKPIAAAGAYKLVTGADLPECHLAVTLAVASQPATATEWQCNARTRGAPRVTRDLRLRANVAALNAA